MAALERAPREFEGGRGEYWDSTGAHPKTKGSWLLGEPDLATLYSVTTALLVYLAVMPGFACCCLQHRSPLRWLLASS